jgi:hypothetical protein
MKDRLLAILFLFTVSAFADTFGGGAGYWNYATGSDFEKLSFFSSPSSPEMLMTKP